MSRHEVSQVRGPEPAGLEDVDAINAVFSDAFTDRYHRDGMTGVRVPFLNPAVWRYALEGAGDGAMVWRDERGRIVAFNMVHGSGIEGWMGPLAVRPEYQGQGLGTAVVREGVHWLQRQGARVIGLETMPRTVENIGFYSRIGFRPAHLTITLAGAAQARPPDDDVQYLSTAGPALGDRLVECGALAGTLIPGLDFSRELALTLELGLGDAALIFEEGRLEAFVLWHAVPLAQGRDVDEVRVLKLVAAHDQALARALAAAETGAARAGGNRLLIRCQTAYAKAYARLCAGGYRVHWTDLRMTMEGFEERPCEGVVFSNWEI